ncbi:unnamed protein product [Vitrella brassicaformis CCMP3155]|uniref:PHD-type domain-containing protein n=2 Tax=Vitrella brassicaformis TaxID=1169539 RepID=A0A0G4FWN9_VITBC|nr:unnamed protein product [Vitrella brassicaformis CCMP3155]|eukprot:CEM19556.1 unnamed protein product [Vitrella brassicaformis CCMP3155]
MSGAFSAPTDTGSPPTNERTNDRQQFRSTAGVLARAPTCPDMNDPQTYQDLATPMPETREENANLYFFRSKLYGHTRHFDFIPFCSNHVRFAKAYLQEPLSDAADDVEVEVQERQRGLRDALQLRYGDIGCILCGSNKEPPIIIMCRGCDSGFHPTCVPVDPRLIAVLEEDW